MLSINILLKFQNLFNNISIIGYAVFTNFRRHCGIVNWVLVTTLYNSMSETKPVIPHDTRTKKGRKTFTKECTCNCNIYSLPFNPNLSSGEPVYRVQNTLKIVFGRGASPPWTPYQGFALDPSGALAAPRPPALTSVLPADHLASGYAPALTLSFASAG